MCLSRAPNIILPANINLIILSTIVFISGTALVSFEIYWTSFSAVFSDFPSKRSVRHYFQYCCTTWCPSFLYNLIFSNLPNRFLFLNKIGFTNYFESITQMNSSNDVVKYLINSLISILFISRDNSSFRNTDVFMRWISTAYMFEK